LSVKAADPVRNVSRHVVCAERILDWQSKVIRRPFRFQIVENRKVEFIVCDIDAAPHRLAVLKHSSDRIVLVAV
jgi:hypothetical protein